MFFSVFRDSQGQIKKIWNIDLDDFVTNYNWHQKVLAIELFILISILSSHCSNIFVFFVLFFLRYGPVNIDDKIRNGI